MIFLDFFPLKLCFFFCDPICDPIRDPIRDPICDPIRDLICDPIRDPIHDPIRDPIRYPIPDPGPIQILLTLKAMVERKSVSTAVLFLYIHEGQFYSHFAAKG